MSQKSFQSPPVAAYITLSPAGEALYRLEAFGLLTVRDACILTEIQWAAPLRVRTHDDAGCELVFEPINMTLAGAMVHNEMTDALAVGEQLWGRMWELKTHSEMCDGFPEEPEMVYSASFLKRLYQSEASRWHEGAALGWFQGDLDKIEVEDWQLPAN